MIDTTKINNGTEAFANQHPPNCNLTARSPSITLTVEYEERNSTIPLSAVNNTSPYKPSSPVILPSESPKSQRTSTGLSSTEAVGFSEKREHDDSTIYQIKEKKSYGSYVSNFIGTKKQGFMPLYNQEEAESQNSENHKTNNPEALPELLPSPNQTLDTDRYQQMENGHHKNISTENNEKFGVRSYQILFDEDIEEPGKRFNSIDIPKENGLMYNIVFGPVKYPIFTWVTGLCMICVFIYELVKNNTLTGNWIQTEPFNPMVGPNYMVLINLGSRFSPCMRELSNYTSTTLFHGCYTNYDSTCTLEDACSFGGFNGKPPNQTFRFFIPIFLHAGFIHIMLNMISHLQFGSEIERTIGVIRYMTLYLGSALWGFIISAIFSSPKSSSMGCSGALFGLLGYSIIKLILEWKNVTNPFLQLTKVIISAVVSIVLGMMPGIDNFAHVGGFIMGFLLSFLLFPLSPYISRGRKLMMNILKCVVLCIIIILFAVLLHLFYSDADIGSICPGCKYISCIPVNGWCDNK